MITRKLFLFSPAFNASDTIEKLFLGFHDLKVVLEQYDCSLHVLIINDASEDDTKKKLENLPFILRSLQVDIINNVENIGNAKNIIRGYHWALDLADDYSLIGCLDADGEHNPLAFRRHIDDIESNECDGVVGSIIYPEDKLGWADLNMMRFCGAIQSTMMNIKDPFYVQSPGHQLHRVKFLRNSIVDLFPKYETFYKKDYGKFPRWGMHAVVDTLLSISGAKLKSAYLECFGQPPNRDAEKLEMQALAALNHQKALREFTKEVKR